MDAQVPKMKTRQKTRGDSESDSSESDLEDAPIEAVNQKLVIEGDIDAVKKEEKSGPVSLYLNDSDSHVYVQNGSATPVGIALSPKEGVVREIYLKNVFVVPPNHELHCPNCKVDIDKVLLCTTQPEKPKPSVPVQPPTQDPHGFPTPHPDPVRPDPGPVDEAPVLCSTCLNELVQKGKELFTWGSRPAQVSTEPDGTVVIPIQDPPLPPPPPPVPGHSTKGWEILKSVVYGGLAELLASLSVVTSAASADATTLSIVALGIANVIGGLSVLGHNLKDLRASEPREEEEENDKYYELLGKRENFFLHASVAILSFLIFGLVPPIVYGFSFRESNDKDLKLAAVAAASLIAITLLAIAKARIQGSNSFVAYLKTVTFYVTSGVLAALLTYVAGAFMKRFIEQLGWFQFEPKSNFDLLLPQMGAGKSGWVSY